MNDLIPTEPDFDGKFYSEEMNKALSEVAKTCRRIGSAPRQKFERERFLSAIAEAFELIGGVPRFAVWADQNPTEFYKLCGKTIPQSTMLDVMGKLTLNILPALASSPLDKLEDITDAEYIEKTGEVYADGGPQSEIRKEGGNSAASS